MFRSGSCTCSRRVLLRLVPFLASGLHPLLINKGLALEMGAICEGLFVVFLIPAIVVHQLVR